MNLQSESNLQWRNQDNGSMTNAPHPLLHSTFAVSIQNPKGFQAADWETAVKNVQLRSNKYYNGVKNALQPNLQYFSRYGPGTYFFFFYLKILTILMFVLSLILLTPIIYNYSSGTAYSSMNNEFNVKVAQLTVGNHLPTADNPLLNKLINVIPSLLCLISSTVFYIYWNVKSQSKLNHIQTTVKMMSYHCIEIYSFAKGTTLNDISQLFLTLNVALSQIVVSKNQSESIYICKLIYDLALDIKEIEMNNGPKDDIEEKEKQIQALKTELDSFMARDGSQTMKFYVVCQEAQERDRVIQEYNSFTNCCCGQPYPPQWYVRDEKVYMRACTNEPSGILWENQHITWRSRWIRWVLHLLLLLLIIFAGFCFIFFLQLLVPPFHNPSIDTTIYTPITIFLLTDTTIIQAWCLAHSLIVDESTPVGTLCSPYVKGFYERQGISIAIAFAVSILSFLLKLIVIRLATLKRFKTQSEQSAAIILNIFFTNMACNLLIIILLQANIFSFSIKRIFGAILRIDQWNNSFSQIAQYSDFTSPWYADVGYQMTITLTIYAVTPLFFQLLYYETTNCLSALKAKSKALQRQMEKTLQREQFAMEEYYANIHSILFLTFILYPGMPHLVPIAFIALLLRYFLYKFIFVRHCRIPPASNELMNDHAKAYFFFALLLNGVFAIWIFGQDSIFQQSISIFNAQYRTAFTSGTLQGFLAAVTQRILNTWYYSFTLALCLLTMLLKSLSSALGAKCFQGTQDTQDTDNQAPKLSGRCITTSYRIEDNPLYSEISAILKRQQSMRPIGYS